MRSFKAILIFPVQEKMAKKAQTYACVITYTSN